MFESDIIASTGDGAASMTAYGKISKLPYWICVNHTLHLSVSDVLYKYFDISLISDDSTNDIYPDDEEINSQRAVLKDLYEPTIKKMRSIIKLFKKSGVKNDVLISIMKSQGVKERRLQLDCPTRWSSLYSSIKIFLEVVEPIQETLIQLNSEHVWSTIDTEILRVSV